jgi:ferritin-like metal-binding protein YciE
MLPRIQLLTARSWRWFHHHHARSVKSGSIMVWQFCWGAEPNGGSGVGKRKHLVEEIDPMAAKTEKTLEDLFHETLKDIYYAERKILKALPKMARGAESPDLKAAFEKHRDETEGQVERLQQVFDMIGKRAQGSTCPAIDGIIEEGEEVLEDFKGSPALDAGLVSAAQAVEHYEITRYGTLKRWAEELGMTDAAKLLDQTLGEESMTDEALTKLAETAANQKAKVA